MEQTFLSTDATWMPIKDGNPSGLSMFLRHYTARQTRNIAQFVGPGEKMVLMTPDALGLFVWRKFISDNRQTGVNCAVFRYEGGEKGRASELIKAANLEAWERWPGERLYTYVDPSKIRHKRDPGRCFRKAGYRVCGMTKRRLLIFECLPEGALPPQAD